MRLVFLFALTMVDPFVEKARRAMVAYQNAGLPYLAFLMKMAQRALSSEECGVRTAAADVIGTLYAAMFEKDDYEGTDYSLDTPESRKNVHDLLSRFSRYLDGEIKGGDIWAE